VAALPLSDDYLTRRVPVVTYTLIAAHVTIYLLSPMSSVALWYGADLVQRLCFVDLYFVRWGAIPAELLGTGPANPPVACPGTEAEAAPRPWMSAVSYIFVHADPWHLLSNMVFLFVFGPGVEDRLGRLRFTVFYLIAGVVAAYGFALGSAESVIPLVGASGAIAGVLGAYLVVQFRSRVVTLLFSLFPVRLPGWAVTATYFVMEYVRYINQDLLPGTVPDVAYGAHVYGFAAGVVGGLLVYRIRWRGGVRLDSG
jgi:membrane associated rhomboid family serine protease